MIDWDYLLNIMEEEAKKRNAPVYALEKDRDAFKILVSAMLSTRTRDEKTAKAVKKLFSRIKSAEDLEKLSEDEIAELIRDVGFYRNKAKMLKKMARYLKGKEIPNSFEELIKIPGVGRKVANIVLSEAFNVDTIAVDTHVHRIANRLGIVRTKTPEETEKALKRIVPRRYWRRINKAFVGYGQVICRALKPRCDECKIANFCEYYRHTEK